MATFWISRLRVIGDKVKPAEVAFGPHLNVVTGLSDTGKSYIRDCINYMFGAKKPPKAIPASVGYSTIIMEITTSEGKRHVLQRSLKKGGEFLIFDQSLDDWTGENGTVLKWKHDPNAVDTLSYYLLRLCGIEKVEISTAKTKKRQLSFRDIAIFSLISETAIIDEWTPIYPNRQYSKRTADKSIFDFLISGDDSSSMITAANPAVTKARWKAKFELYGQLIDDLKSEAPADTVKAGGRLKDIESVVDSITSTITESNNAISAEQERRSRSWQAWHTAKSRQAVVEQLLLRFDILAKHYRSDIERLTFLAEADHYLSQFGQEVYCPVCGKLMKEHEDGQHDATPASQEIKVASRAEATKLEALLKDLQSTVESLRSEQVALAATISNTYGQVQSSEAILKRDLEPRMLVAKKELATILEERRVLVDSLEAEKRLKALKEKQVQLGPEPKQTKSKKGEDEIAGDVGPRRDFLDQVAKLLTAWKYSPVGVAEFNEDMDLVIAKQTRASYGKGVRAILHAAFTLALMIQAKGRHPGLIILDSPLTSYKEKDSTVPTYEMTKDVQRGFFEYLINYKDNQVIVLENKEPNDDLKSKMHYEFFSRDKSIGRYGFYPT